MDRADGVGKQRGDGDDRDIFRQRIGVVFDRVGDEQSFDGALLNAFAGAFAEHAVADGGVNVARPALFEQFRHADQRSAVRCGLRASCCR